MLDVAQSFIKSNTSNDENDEVSLPLALTLES